MDAPDLPDQLTLRPGASTTLDVPGHGIGGYVWTASVETGPGRIEPHGVTPSAKGIGAGGSARFVLTWLGEQPGTVTFVLKRPWESEPVATHRIRVETDA